MEYTKKDIGSIKKIFPFLEKQALFERNRVVETSGQSAMKYTEQDMINMYCQGTRDSIKSQFKSTWATKEFEEELEERALEWIKLYKGEE
jgi:hypothetical protein